MLLQNCGGYGKEVLRAVIDYGYKQAGAQCIVALIHRENIASQKLALAMGMEYIEDTCYCGIGLMVYIRYNNFLAESGSLEISEMI